jgi:hypothetical protein
MLRDPHLPSPSCSPFTVLMSLLGGSVVLKCRESFEPSPLLTMQLAIRCARLRPCVVCVTLFFSLPPCLLTPPPCGATGGSIVCKGCGVEPSWGACLEGGACGERTPATRRVICKCWPPFCTFSTGCACPSGFHCPLIGCHPHDYCGCLAAQVLLRHNPNVDEGRRCHAKCR